MLVECAGVGVNYADCVVRMGLYSSAKEFVGWPITPGFEFAGRVAQVGAGVTDVAVGDEVLGVMRFGAYASHVVVPSAQLFARPSTMSAQAAAAFPVVALTAWYALHELGAVRSGQTILVHSAAGGVGGTLVQLGRIAGCTVVGVVGHSSKVDAARQLGATHVIDKSSEDLWTVAKKHAPKGFDIVLDANGVETLGKSYAHMAPEGRLIVYGFHTMLSKTGRRNWLALAWNFLRTPRFNAIDMTNTNRSVLAFNLSYLFERTDFLRSALTELLALQESGQLQTPTLTTYPLEGVADAHRDLESARTIGKLVLEP